MNGVFPDARDAASGDSKSEIPDAGGTAKKARVTQAYIAQLETGTRQDPSLSAIQCLAKALKVKLPDLLK